MRSRYESLPGKSIHYRNMFSFAPKVEEWAAKAPHLHLLVEARLD
jgi:hypothetical protein